MIAAHKVAGIFLNDSFGQLARKTFHFFVVAGTCFIRRSDAAQQRTMSGRIVRDIHKFCLKENSIRGKLWLRFSLRSLAYMQRYRRHGHLILRVNLHGQCCK